MNDREMNFVQLIVLGDFGSKVLDFYLVVRIYFSATYFRCSSRVTLRLFIALSVGDRSSIGLGGDDEAVQRSLTQASTTDVPFELQILYTSRSKEHLYGYNFIFFTRSSGNGNTVKSNHQLLLSTLELTIILQLVSSFQPTTLVISNDSYLHRNHAPMRAQGGGSGETRLCQSYTYSSFV